jgi:hypothetical protein
MVIFIITFECYINQKSAQSHLAVMNSTIHSTNFHLLHFMEFSNSTIHRVMRSIEAREVEEQYAWITWSTKWWNYFINTKTIVDKSRKEGMKRIIVMRNQTYPVPIEFKPITEPIDTPTIICQDHLDFLAKELWEIANGLAVQKIVDTLNEAIRSFRKGAAAVAEDAKYIKGVSIEIIEEGDVITAEAAEEAVILAEEAAILEAEALILRRG